MVGRKTANDLVLGAMKATLGDDSDAFLQAIREIGAMAVTEYARGRVKSSMHVADVMSACIDMRISTLTWVSSR